MAILSLGNKTVVTQAGSSDPVLASNVTIDNGVKFPVGHVIQTRGVSFDDNFSLQANNSGQDWTEVANHGSSIYPMRVTITPTSTSNKLLMTLSLQLNDTGVNDISNWKFYDITGSQDVTPIGLVNGNRQRSHFSTRGAYHDSNDTICYPYVLFADIARTTETIYTLYYRNADGNGELKINHTSRNNADSWDATMVSTFIIQEIQQ